MILLGHIRDSLPRVSLELAGAEGPLTVEFIVDTAFEGDLTLPSNLLQRVVTEPLFTSLRSLADGSVRECPVNQLELDWNEDTRKVEVLGLDHNPLLGVLLLEGSHLELVFAEGSEVLIELPD